MMSGRHSRFDYDSYPSYGEHLRLPPESASDHYYVVYVRFTGQPATNMSECQFDTPPPAGTTGRRSIANTTSRRTEHAFA